MHKGRWTHTVTHKQQQYIINRAPAGSAADNKKAQLSLTNPRDACEKFARFT